MEIKDNLRLSFYIHQTKKLNLSKADVASVDCEPKGHWFNFQLEHMWVVVQVPSRGSSRGNHTLFLSLSFFLLSPLSKINK